MLGGNLDGNSGYDDPPVGLDFLGHFSDMRRCGPNKSDQLVNIKGGATDKDCILFGYTTDNSSPST